MPPLDTREIEVRAQVLERHLSGESHLRLHLLCPQNGRLVGLWRIGRKKGAPPAPDLFDIGSFLLRSGSREMWFVQEFRLEVHHEAVARRYANLQAASLWAQFLWKNLLHAEDCAEPARLCAQAIGGFAEYGVPSCVLLKAKFSLLRSEGYAIREDWLRGLSASARQKATHILNSPLRDLGDADEAFCKTALLPTLQRWLRTHSEFEVLGALGQEE